MERQEPTLQAGEPAAEAEWGNVRFRSRRSGPSAGTADDNADARFWIGWFTFVFVALVFPWYSYRVVGYLMTRDLQVAGEALGRELEASSARVRRQIEASTAQARGRSAADAARRQAAADRARIDAVRVLGTLPGKEGPVAIVRFGDAELPEASAAICRQATVMLGASLEGQELRVQQYRGSAPALTVGAIRC